ncbi:MAG: citrulline utilization hydrolase CtlX, partial [Saprospiraceae bacterium]
MSTQSTSHILMVRPAHFGYNQQTAVNNAFMKQPDKKEISNIAEQAVQEFDDFVNLLRAAGVNVLVIEDSDTPAKPDAVFPNNWITTHPNNAVITYPMFSPLRRLERRDEIIDIIEQQFIISKRIRLEKYEKENRFLEGTGSIILDRPNNLAYACVSGRTDEQLFYDFCKYVEYQPVLFHSTDQNSFPVYHTNVMMAMGTQYVVICMESITDPDENKRLRELFKQTGKEIIDLTHEQMNSFAGNMLEVQNANGDTLLVMSEQANHSLDDQQILQISNYTDILYAPIYTIEKYSG